MILTTVKAILIVTLVVVLGVTAEVNAQGPTGKWSAKVRIDPITDKDSSVLSVENDQSSGLAVVCSSKSFEVQWVFGRGRRLIGLEANYGLSGVLVRYRFDKNEPQEWGAWVALSRVTDRVFIYPSAGKSFDPPERLKEFMRSLMNGTLLTIQARDLTDGDEITQQFPLAGFSRALAGLPCRDRILKFVEEMINDN